jgi:hypothetical protein
MSLVRSALVLAGLTAAVAVSVPTAARAEIERTFGNTLVSRYPDGGWVRHWFNADGSYSARFSSGRTVSARWRVEGDRVCLNNISPAMMMISRFCSPMIEAGVGDSWTSRDPLGRRVTNVLQRGR